LSQPRLRVDVESPSGRHTLEVPQDATIEDLVWSLVEVCEGRADGLGWTLVPKGEAPLPGALTLGECGIFAGAVLVLVEPEPVQEAEPDHVRVPSPAAEIDRAGDASYIRVLDGAIVAPRLRASNVIAVISDHPGAGATTITVLLATALGALRDDQLAVVDADSQSGALSHWMAPDSSVSKDVYGSLFRPNVTPEQVRAALVGAGPRLSLLPAPAKPSNAIAPGAVSWSRLIDHLRHLHNIVILDCGAGIQRAVSRASIDAADQVVLVTTPQLAKRDETKSIAESIRATGKTVVLVANQAPNRARSARSSDGVQRVTITYDPHHAKRLRTRGFTWAGAPVSWQISVRELAAVLVGSLG
jgi:MinD-like ATPase involved in chromosome partitioning or flagellar assembly